MQIKIGFSASSSWISRVILACTGGDVSHAFLHVTFDGLPEPLVLQEATSGWAFDTLSEFTRGTTRIVRLIDPPVPLETAFEESLRYLSERYSYGGLLGMAWVMLGRRLGRKWRNPIRTSNEAFCSQMVTWVLQRAGWGPALALDAESVDPFALETLLLKQPVGVMARRKAA